MLKVLRNTFLHPLKEFIHDSKSIGIVLLSCTFISLLLSNFSATSNFYQNIWHINISGNAAEHHAHFLFLSIPNTLLVFINDFLMSFFFLLAGMEIKRELVQGELSSIKNTLLPVFGAVGGMLIPAILFIQFNKETAYINGWAIPTATDIAFTLGVASLLGKRVPVALKIFITALAIIDDLGAIIVIALFYGSKLKILYLLLAFIITVAIYFINKQKIKFGIWQIVLALALWYCMFNSGIHATVAGVIFALLIPQNLLTKFELKLHATVYFFIMPLFALANTAIAFPQNIVQNLTSSLSIGIFIALVVGKPLGIFTACYVLVKNKWAQLPTKTNWQQLIGASILAGIGFTMSIFIATLAFKEKENQDTAKIAILFASISAMVVGFIWLKVATKNSIIYTNQHAVEENITS